MVAGLGLGSDIEAINKQGYTEVCAEPTVGSGSMILGAAQALQAAGYDYHNQMVVTATDLDLKCVYMAYIQFALSDIPAIVVHGNALTGERWSSWYTPAYLVGGWPWKRSVRGRE